MNQTHCSQPKCIMSECPDLEALRFLDERIDEENIARTQIKDVRLLAIVLRDDSAQIIAGIHGWTWGQCCEVKTLWVDEKWRGLGLGTHLMIAAEQEARLRGAAQMILSTHSFQAPEFYFRLGFAAFAQVENHPVGHANLYLRKQLLSS